MTANCLTIYNSWKAHKCQMRSILEQIKKECTVATEVWKRSFFSMKMEWICHNFLYSVGYEKDRTRDVDLDNPCDRPEWQYIICGILFWLFVW